MTTYMMRGTCAKCGETLTVLFEERDVPFLKRTVSCGCGGASATTHGESVAFSGTREWNTQIKGWAR